MRRHLLCTHSKRARDGIRACQTVVRWWVAGQGQHYELNKERLYERGIEAYMMTLPVLNVIGMRDGSEGKFGKGLHFVDVALG